MKTAIGILLSAISLTGLGVAAEPAERVRIDANTDECELFRSLNGADGLPDECKAATSKAFFAQPAKPRVSVLDSVSFEFNSDRLTGDSEAVLARVAKVMRNPVSHKQHYRIEGHTDRKGKEGINQRLSDKRARSVQHFLIQAGVPEERVTAKGFGSKQPADPNDPYAAVNRRVEIANQSR